jgi:L-fuconolactonase
MVCRRGGIGMRIDAHQHFWTYRRDDYGWIDDSMRALQRDFGPPDLAPLLRAADFDGTVAVQATQTVKETEWLLETAAENPLVKAVVGWVDLRARTAREDLERLSRNPRLCGVRHVVQDEPDDRFLLRDDFLRGVALLEDFDLTYDILIYPKQLPAAIEFVRRFPRQRLVLDHLAKPAIREGALEPWASQIREMARQENLFCKVSGMVTEANWSRWKKPDFTPYLDVVFEAFGPGRILFGSDWPVCLLAASYEDVLGIVNDYISRLSKDERAAVMGENAERFYQLGKRGPA